MIAIERGVSVIERYAAVSLAIGWRRGRPCQYASGQATEEEGHDARADIGSDGDRRQ